MLEVPEVSRLETRPFEGEEELFLILPDSEALHAAGYRRFGGPASVRSNHERSERGRPSTSEVNPMDEVLREDVVAPRTLASEPDADVKAVELLLALLGSGPDLGGSGTDELLRRAESAYLEGRLGEAIPLYRALLAAGVAPGLVLFRLGTIANNGKKYDVAWTFHCRAVALDPALASRITPPEFAHHNLILKSRYDEEEVAACPVCGHTGQVPMMVVSYLIWPGYHPPFHPVLRWVQCQSCGHGFRNPRPSAAACREAYAEPPPPHLLYFDYPKLVTYSTIIRRLWMRRPGGDFLDVGVSLGSMAGLAVDFGYRAYGMDVHSGYQDSVRRFGVEFLQGDISTYDFSSRRFDVICMGDVIEHVLDPKVVLSNVLSALKPGGLIWLSTPNYEGTWTRYHRENDPMWKEGEHLQYFSLRSLRRLLDDHGLQIIDLWLSQRYFGYIEVIIERKPSGR